MSKICLVASVDSWRHTSHDSEAVYTVSFADRRTEPNRVSLESSWMRERLLYGLMPIVRVNAEAAKAYAAASAEEREKIHLLLSMRLSQVTRPSASLEQAMRETSDATQRQGMTGERLSEMFREE
jgi:hypothetical protein